MIDSIKHIKWNNTAVFFWTYCLYGIFIYWTNISMFFIPFNLLSEIEEKLPGFIFIYGYNLISNGLLSLGLIFLTYLLYKRKKIFLKLYLWHTLILAVVNYYNEYLIDNTQNFPEDSLNILNNTVTGNVVLMWLIASGIMIEKYGKGKKYFLD